MRKLTVVAIVLLAVLFSATSALSFSMTEDFTNATIINGGELTTSSGLNQWNDLVRWQIATTGGNTGSWAVHTPREDGGPEESLLFYGWDATGMGIGSTYSFSLDFLNDSSGFTGRAYIGGLDGVQKISPWAPWPNLSTTYFDSAYLSNGITSWSSILLEGTITADYDVLYIAIQMGGTGGVRGIDNVSVQVAPVPEPGTLLLLGSGLAGLALYRRRMNKA